MHTHLATVGWLVNMVFGVALWMFPLPWGVTSERRYNRTLVGVAWIGINGGLALRFAGDILANVPLQIASGVLQTGGILLCVGALWPRIRTLAPTTPDRQACSSSQRSQSIAAAQYVPAVTPAGTASRRRPRREHPSPVACVPSYATLLVQRPAPEDLRVRLVSDGEGTPSVL